MVSKEAVWCIRAYSHQQHQMCSDIGTTSGPQWTHTLFIPLQHAFTALPEVHQPICLLRHIERYHKNINIHKYSANNCNCSCCNVSLIQICLVTRGCHFIAWENGSIQPVFFAGLSVGAIFRFYPFKTKFEKTWTVTVGVCDPDLSTGMLCFGEHDRELYTQRRMHPNKRTYLVASHSFELSWNSSHCNNAATQQHHGHLISYMIGIYPVWQYISCKIILLCKINKNIYTNIYKIFTYIPTSEPSSNSVELPGHPLQWLGRADAGAPTWPTTWGRWAWRRGHQRHRTGGPRAGSQDPWQRRHWPWTASLGVDRKAWWKQQHTATLFWNLGFLYVFFPWTFGSSKTVAVEIVTLPSGPRLPHPPSQSGPWVAQLRFDPIHPNRFKLVILFDRPFDIWYIISNLLRYLFHFSGSKIQVGPHFSVGFEMTTLHLMPIPRDTKRL